MTPGDSGRADTPSVLTGGITGTDARGRGGRDGWVVTGIPCIGRQRDTPATKVSATATATPCNGGIVDTTGVHSQSYRKRRCNDEQAG